MNRIFLAVLGMTLCIGPLAPVPTKAAERGPMTVAVDPVRSENASQKLPMVGRIVALRRGAVAARTPGLIGELRVEVGDRIEGGAVIATLKDDRLTAERNLRAAEVDAAKSAVTAANAELKLRRQEYDRLEGLQKSPAFSVGRFDDKAQEVSMSTSMLSQARSNLVRAEAQHDLTEIALSDAEIRAPYGGVVVRRLVEVGEYVDIGDPIVRLVDDTDLEIEVDVPGNRIMTLGPGASVSVDVAGATVMATVRAVLPEENPRTRTRTVRLTADLAEMPFLADNQDAVVQVPVGDKRNVLTVHKDAILPRGGGYQVFVAVEGAAEVRNVEIGDAIGNRFEVLSGLTDNDLVVVRGNERLRPGAAIVTGDGPRG